MNLDVQVKNAVNDLVDMGVEFKKAQRGIINALVLYGKKLTRANMYGSGMGTVNGWLSRHVYGVRRSETHGVVAAPMFKAEILERGGIIKAKKEKYLTFKVNGEWKKVKSVKIPAKKWFTEATRGMESSDAYMAAINQGIDKVLKKYNKDRA